MQVEINLEVKPSYREIQNWIKEIEQNTLDDMSNFWEMCERLVAEILTERFQTEDKGRWAALSPRYKKWKEKHYPGRTILRLTGVLFRAATEKGSLGNICTETPTSLTWGVDTGDIPWAAYVQDKRPSRIWCSIAGKEEMEVAELLRKWLRVRLDREARKVKGR